MSSKLRLFTALCVVLGLVAITTVAQSDPVEQLIVTVGDASVDEGTGEFVELSFPVTLSGTPSEDVVIRFSTLGLGKDGGTAKGGAQANDERDFLSFTNEELIFESGTDALSQAVTIKVLGDENVEDDETVTLRAKIKRKSSVVFADGEKTYYATGTIIDDDVLESLQVEESLEETQVYGAGTTTPQPPCINVSPGGPFRIKRGSGARHEVSLCERPTGTVYVDIKTSSIVTGELVWKTKGTLTFYADDWWDDKQVMTIWAPVKDDATTSYEYRLHYVARAPGTNYEDSENSVDIFIDPDVATFELKNPTSQPEEGSPMAIYVKADRKMHGRIPVQFTFAPTSGSGFTADDIVGGLTQTLMVDFGDNSSVGKAHLQTVYDGVSEGRETCNVTISEPTDVANTNGWKVGDDTTVRCYIDNLDSPVPTATPTPASAMKAVFTPETLVIPEGKSAGYSVALSQQPTGDSIVQITYHYGTTDSAAVSSSVLTFTQDNWNVPQWVRVWTLHDVNTVDEVITITHTLRIPGQSTKAAGSVTVTVTDDDD